MENELKHHGIKGQKWGLRRYQNKDGSYTSDGRRHYGYSDGQHRTTGKVTSSGRSTNSRSAGKQSSSQNKKLKTALKIGAAAAATGLAIYGGYKVSQYIKGKTGSLAMKEGQNIVSFAVSRTEIPRTKVSRTEIPRTKIDFSKMSMRDLEKLDLY